MKTKVDMLKYRRAIRPDAQAFDEIRVITVPRYKTSGLSGDEWRIGALIQFLRKGEVKHEAFYTKMEYAIGAMQHEWGKAIEEGKACFGGEGDICDQEGCKEEAVVTYALKKKYCNKCGNGTDATVEGFKDQRYIRRFCLRHSKRGDCALEDADNNYEILEAPEGFDPDAQLNLEDASPSVFGGIIDLTKEE
jgi:hypothetical protein